MQNAYSRAGQRRDRAAARRARHGQRRLPAPARPAPDHLGEPERADVRGRRHQQRLPPEPGLRQQQPVLARWRLELSRPARLVRAAAGARGAATASPTRYSKAMDNVGEFFFSSPIDPFDISKDWGRSDDDQRHRVVVYASVNSPTATAATTWEHISHGFQDGPLLCWTSRVAQEVREVEALNDDQTPPRRPQFGQGITCQSG